MEAIENRLPQTLYNRLKDEYAKDLDAVATKYPNLHSDVKRALQAHTFYTDMTYGDALNLASALNRNVNEIPLFFNDYESH